ncbi:hypothetical protein GCM10022207_85910 [Streptomyces lannensis]|uniref:Uncharacterized protein n=1 Tax=Streptomyces lannensis TaxID=766498 RepID=A0ABP7LLR7_9ACTN
MARDAEFFEPKARATMPCTSEPAEATPAAPIPDGEEGLEDPGRRGGVSVTEVAG